MIKHFHIAVRAIVDSRFVMLQPRATGVEANYHWSKALNDAGQDGLTYAVQSFIALDFQCDFIWALSALRHSGAVGVVAVQHDAMTLDVCKGVFNDPAVAAEVGLDAVNQLLY